MIEQAVGKIRALIPGLPLLLSIAVLLIALAIANAAGLVIGNSTTSVPRGIYYAAAPERARYVSFCLARQHRRADYYAYFCSPDRPDGIRILKRIEERTPDGSLIVQGDSRRALDSRYLGPVHHDQIRGWWRSLIQIPQKKKEFEMPKTKDPAPLDKPPATASKRRARGPGRTDDERVAVIKADLPRLRDRAEAQLIHAASQAGLFDCRFTTPELRAMLKDALGREARPISLLQKNKREIVQIKSRKRRSRRIDDARRKALLGGFMVAQFRHKPELHAQLAPDLRAHLAAHPKPALAEANITFMTAVLSNPSGVEDTEETPTVTGISPEQARRNQARRMILVGAWALDRRSAQPIIETLIQDELATFLQQDRAPARNIALLHDVLGVF